MMWGPAAEREPEQLESAIAQVVRGTIVAKAKEGTGIDWMEYAEGIRDRSSCDDNASSALCKYITSLIEAMESCPKNLQHAVREVPCHQASFTPSFEGVDQYVTINDMEFGPYNQATLLDLVGHHAFFMARKGTKWYVNVDGETYGPYDALEQWYEFDPAHETHTYYVESKTARGATQWIPYQKGEPCSGTSMCTPSTMKRTLYQGW